jgi:NADPH2:quinone reductase
MTIPTEMRALVLQSHDDDLTQAMQVVTKPVPIPGPGQVLVRMEASPVNPSDTMFLKGRYGVKKDLPVVPGFEGSGTVVASGGGVLGSLWNSRRVACFASDGLDGTWAEYMVTDATRVIPVGKNVSFEQAATALVNPLTALALLEIAREKRAKAIVSTAAASQLGQMLLRLGNRRGVPIIHIVRRDEQVAHLKAMGGRYVLNSTNEDFESDLKQVTRELKSTLLVDAVAGDLTGQTLSQMPRGSTAVIYGALAMAPAQISASNLIFRNQRVEGFWLAKPMEGLSVLSMLRLLIRGRAVLNGDDLTQSEIRGSYSLEEAVNGIQEYAERMSDGKVIITPQA